MRKPCLFILFILIATVLHVEAKSRKKKVPAVKESTIEIVNRVNHTYQSQHSPEVWAFWDHAAYFTGNMEAYKLIGRAEYLEYSDRWARHNQWQGARETDKRLWKYKNYGESQQHVLFGDWQICFQTYADMYVMNPDDYKIARAKEVMGYECALSDNKFWWWADALYMVMPVMTKLYNLTGDRCYLDKLYQNFCWADSLMFDKDEHLYYRDAKYIFPKVKTASGGKSFWARGDGWVLAGLAKVIQDLPKDWKHRDLFVTRFQQLAHAVAKCQQKGGYWSRSMLCEADAPGPETSGTAFFTYGMLWGVNHGLLDKQEFAPTIERAWHYLVTTALQPDGTIGYVQPIGEKPDPTKTVDAHSQAPFGTGAFLLAACERVRYEDSSVVARPQSVIKLSVGNQSARQRYETVEIDAKTIYKKLSISGGRQFVVRDASGQEIPYQITHDGKVVILVSVAPHGKAHLTIGKGLPRLYQNVSYGRMYPERLDDITWENDRGIYRCYGPALQRQGQKVYGYDVWTKNTPELVVEQRYHDEAIGERQNRELRALGRKEEGRAAEDALSYHIDHGRGLDCYSVGTTLGAGTSALLHQGEIVYPYCWKEYEILDNGPLRFTLRLVYNPSRVGADTAVVETRTIRLDALSNLNHAEVNYSGLSDSCMVASGCVVHSEDASSYFIDKSGQYFAYADPTENRSRHNFQIYTSCLSLDGGFASFVPLKTRQGGNEGHLLLTKNYSSGDTFSYYFGSAWSKYDVRSLDAWKLYLDEFLLNKKQPLEVTFE